MNSSGGRSGADERDNGNVEWSLSPMANDADGTCHSVARRPTYFRLVSDRTDGRSVQNDLLVFRLA